MQRRLKCLYVHNFLIEFEDEHKDELQINCFSSDAQEFEIGKTYILTIEPQTYDPPPFKGEMPMAQHMVM